MFSLDERAVAQGFSVHVWGTWGRRFKSAQPDLHDFYLFDTSRWMGMVQHKYNNKMVRSLYD